MNQLLTRSARALAEAIRSGKISSEELVGAHIKRIEEVNPHLNAVVQLTAESALALAQRIEEAFGGWKPPAIFE